RRSENGGSHRATSGRAAVKIRWGCTILRYHGKDMATGAELFASSLTRLGIDTVFTLVGDHLNEVLLAIAQAGIRIIDMRHESGVTHAADAWARIYRKPALTLVT